MTNSNNYNLTGGDFASGGAQDNTQTDIVNVNGDDNFFYSLGGNLTVQEGNPSVYGPDSATSVYLDKYTNPAQPSRVVKGVTDSITLDGGDNLLTNTKVLSEGPTPIVGSTISFTVLSNGLNGDNTVSLTDVSSSSVTFVDNGPVGSDSVTIGNRGGFTNVTLSGPDNNVSVNSDATNTIAFTKTSGGGNTVTVGMFDDDKFGFASSISLVGAGNTIYGGDANLSISGSTGTSTFSLGDGDDSVSASGVNNTIAVGGGNDTINAGGGGSSVYIVGVDAGEPETGTGTGPVVENQVGGRGNSESNTNSNSNSYNDDTPVPTSPTDTVAITGIGDTVSASYENVIVTGTSIQGANIDLGDGNNLVSLQGSGGYSTVTVGNGGNSINVGGNYNHITVGDGFNGVTTSGNYNSITSTDSSGVGFDVVQLGAGTGDYVQLNSAGGSVTGNGTGEATVYQTGGSAVTVNLGNGQGLITLGDGNDTVNVQGPSSQIKLGNGTDVVTANGASDHITAGNGNDIVTANGSSDLITLGNGNDKLAAIGQYDQISVGNGNDTLNLGVDGRHYQGSYDVITAGNGSDNIVDNGNYVTGTFGNTTAGGKGETGLNLSATGGYDNFTVIASAASSNTFSIGANSTLTWEGATTVGGNSGAVVGTLFGANDTITLDNTMRQGTQIYADGNGDQITFNQEAGGYLTLNPSSTGDTINVDADAASMYKRQIDISGFGSGDVLDLQGLKDTGGHSFSNPNGTVNYSVLFNDLAHGASPTGDTLSLLGGGSITFDKVTSFNASEFAVSGNVNTPTAS